MTERPRDPVRLGRYELGELLGVGGAGRVHRAVQRVADGRTRAVALKLMHRDSGGLEREARLGGLLRHAHLVDVYEVGRVDGTWFCAMEICEGGSLSDHLPLPPRAVVEVGLQVCDALGYAHRELGLVHLDLKPLNLLLSGSTVKVADLGIANARGFESDGRVRGTPAYMAPEQLAGGPVDARTDIYAMGVVLYELATGRQPGASDTFSLDDDFGDGGGALALDAVPWIADVIERCLEQLPEARFPDMDALAAALRALEVEGDGLATHLGIEPEPVTTEVQLGRTNIGPEPDAFVGRELEIEALTATLEPGAAILLKGPGGIGKTRLALAVARRLGAASGEQAWWVDLSAARDTSQALEAIAAVLGVPLVETAHAEAAAHIGRALAGRGQPILVLDTLEPLDDPEGLVALLRAHASRARLLLTSRERVTASATVEVEPLDEERSVELLVQRALLRGVDVAGQPAIRELARRLEGVPLALELAAGRLGVLSADEVVERLGLSLLRSGRTEEGDRQATLRGALDWSWELLSPAERSTLAQVSVFRGGFTLAAAEAVVRGDRPTVESIDGLVDHSLVVARDGRLRLLDVVRAYAGEHLDDDGARARHGAYYATLGAPAALTALNLHGGFARRRALAAERDNLRAAARRATATGDASIAVPALRALAEIVELSGGAAGLLEPLDAARSLALEPLPRALLHLTAARVARLAGRIAEAEADVAVAREGVQAQSDPALSATCALTEGVVALTLGRWEEAERVLRDGIAAARTVGRDDLEGMLLGNLGHLRLRLGDATEARACAERAIACARSAGNRRGEAIVLGNRALIQRGEGDTEGALASMRTALAIHRESGDRRFEGLTLSNLGSTWADAGETALALDALNAAVALHRELGSRELLADTACNLGRALQDSGQPERARASYQEALAIHREIGERMWMGLDLANLGTLAFEADAPDEARRWLEEALALHEANADPMWTAVDRHVLAKIALFEGRLEEARDLADAATRGLEGVHRQGWLLVRATRAEVHAAVGAPDPAIDPRAELDAIDAAQLEAGWWADRLETEVARARVAFRAGDPAAGRSALDRVLAEVEARGLATRTPLGHSISWARALDRYPDR